MRENRVRTAALEHIRKHGECRAGAIRDALGCSSGQLSAAMRLAVREGLVVERRDGGALYYGPPPDEAPQPFRVARWADGDVDIYQAIELDDGGIRLTADMVRQLMTVLGPVTN